MMTSTQCTRCWPQSSIYIYIFFHVRSLVHFLESMKLIPVVFVFCSVGGMCNFLSAIIVSISFSIVSRAPRNIDERKRKKHEKWYKNVSEWKSSNSIHVCDFCTIWIQLYFIAVKQMRDSPNYKTICCQKINAISHRLLVISLLILFFESSICPHLSEYTLMTAEEEKEKNYAIKFE